ncbi:hypothetical protein [Costertonia aggregata]|uniref:Type II secretion system protein n=1 Tax=Costertonia aggregata TaxID=343403 RepID=A0A7H9ATI6_9FLAO|nr:hypothetical protein [Costertonia aggregata]QLG46788.1 hypothetical protein HYG79_15995 [Costertonia aggregata]
MAVLKRVKGSTLMETMVATVLIVIIFMMASLVMEATFSTHRSGNMEPISEKLHQLEYKYIKGGLTLPYFEDWEDWDIEIVRYHERGSPMISLIAKNRKTQKSRKTYLLQNNESH